MQTATKPAAAKQANKGTQAPAAKQATKGTKPAAKAANPLRTAALQQAAALALAPVGVQPAAPAPVANALHALVDTLVGAAPAAPAPTGPAPVVMHAGFATTALPKNIAQRGANLGKLAPEIAKATLILGKQYRVRTTHTAAWANIALQLAGRKGGATGQAIVDAGCPAHMLTYMVNKGRWLVPTTVAAG